ncbi:uncharacterized protein LOC114851756 [Betta splendens]|uniref:Uncharacterized protein LOC114851756 n=1 Tax=Betta splendens TaxID=158456 RepID=A0A6P7LZ87_BETSP|nr:uncharacterized protein LOC114851756 [Betta splendens]
MEEINCMTSEEEEDEEEEEDGKEEENVQQDESTVQQPHRPAWAPCVLYTLDKDVYYYAGQRIVISGAFDSFAGMTWPAALALCHYLDTHREQLDLVDKAVLEIGAGTGLVSVVAALLGAWVTATDLPEYLNNLRVNLSRNTRGRCRHTPQAAALSWGYDLESTYPSTVYRYDYVLAADVVYHHDFLDELLASMKHFCRPGSALIWANKIRLGSDLTFIEKFKKALDTSLLYEEGDMKIFMAKCREDEGDGDKCLNIQNPLREEKEANREKEEEEEEEEASVNVVQGNDMNRTEETVTSEADRRNEDLCVEEEERKQTMVPTGGTCEKGHSEDGRGDDPLCCTTSGDNITEHVGHTAAPTWTPTVICSFGKDVYHYVGQDIAIYESIDSFGAVMWPAALALCHFLENNRDTVDLQGKTVLELGAGTGLVTIVASLLGAAVTATDLPDVLNNLRANVMRNTRGRCRQMPQVAALSWGYDLESTYPSTVYRYDYVLAADVVYHHDFLDELLASMKHFCRPGSALIWANKIRLGSDLTFIEKFKKAFDTRLLYEEGDMKIFMAKCRGRD